MSSSMMMLGVTIKLFDQMSGGLKGISTQVGGLQGKLQALQETTRRIAAAGRGALANGLIGGGALMKSVSAFSDLEDASTRLKVTMMDRNGLVGAFTQVNALAVKLGNELPGTSADFLNMMAALKAQGIKDDSILGGVGEATAKMAVLLKKTPEEMAVFSAKLKTALGVADSDMLAFMDTIQRTYFQGVDATEMMYAFARSGGALKTLKQQGLDAGKALAPLYALWVKGGMSGETVGTGFAAISGTLLDAKKLGKGNAILKSYGKGPLNFTDKKGNFLGIEHMVKEFDKLKSLDSVKLNTVLKEIFGGGQDQQMVATLVTEGLAGYRKMVADMDKQADLQKRVGIQLGTLKNLWDAASGTFTNTLAAFSGAMGEDLKAITEWFGKLSESVGNLIKENPELAQWLGRAALALAGIAVVGGTLAIAVGGIGAMVGWFGLLVPAVLSGVGAFAMLLTALSTVGAFMLANPIVLAITALALAAGLIYENWSPIKAFFVDLWAGIKSAFASAIDWISSKMQALANLLPSFGNLLPDWLKTPAVNISRNEVFGPVKPGAVVPGGQDSKVGGDIRIRVDQDARVTSITGRTDNPRVPFNLDAGYSMVAP